MIAVGPLLRELLVACTDEALPEPEVRRIRLVLRDQLRRTRQEPIMLPAASDPRLAAACELVAADLGTPRPLASLAAEVGAGERTLSRLFRDEFGMTYPQWRTRVRVFEAMVLLAGGTPVTETAHRCGWATTSAFIDTFQRMMGRTPGAYKSGRSVWRRGESNPYLGRAKAACSRYHYAPGTLISLGRGRGRRRRRPSRR